MPGYALYVRAQVACATPSLTILLRFCLLHKKYTLYCLDTDQILFIFVLIAYQIECFEVLSVEFKGPLYIEAKEFMVKNNE